MLAPQIDKRTVAEYIETRPREHLFYTSRAMQEKKGLF
jgi:hypothetical protein